VNPTQPYRCTQFCTSRAASCLELARHQTDPVRCSLFMRLAAHWNEIAAACDRRAHPWTQWCQLADMD
jgi:hypothetical protein